MLYVLIVLRYPRQCIRLHAYVYIFLLTGSLFALRFLDTTPACIAGMLNYKNDTGGFVKQKSQ